MEGGHKKNVQRSYLGGGDFVIWQSLSFGEVRGGVRRGGSTNR